MSRLNQAREHFRLAFLATVEHVVDQLAISLGSREAVFEEFPFLLGYWDELRSRGGDGYAALASFESATVDHLPLRALAHVAGASHAELLLLMAIGPTEQEAG